MTATITQLHNEARQRQDIRNKCAAVVSIMAGELTDEDLNRAFDLILDASMIVATISADRSKKHLEEME